MARPGRVEEIAGQHRVELEPGQPNALPREHEGIELQVVTDLPDRRIFEKGPKSFESGVAVELQRSAGARKQIVAAIRSLVSDGNVACLTIAR